MGRISAAFLILASLVFYAMGCGYTTSTLVFEGADTICIDNFSNKIDLTRETTDKRMYIGYRSGMELDVTKDVINEFIIDGNLKVVPADRADMILKGELVDFRKDALRYDSANNVIEYRVKVLVNFTLTKRVENELLLNEVNFTGESVYITQGAESKTESQAIKAATRDLAERIVEKVVEGW